jgi:hypothetical protein
MVENPPPQGRYLRIVWVDFETSPAVPSGFAEAFHYVHTSGEDPVLYLNSRAKAPLRKLFDTKGYGHPIALPRDVLFSSVAVAVWTTLVHAALQALRDEVFPVDFEEAFGGTWQGQVLKWISARVRPEMLPDAALFEFCQKMQENDYYSEVLARAQAAIQSEQDLLGNYDQFAEGVFAHA